MNTRQAKLDFMAVILSVLIGIMLFVGYVHFGVKSYAPLSLLFMATAVSRLRRWRVERTASA